jgi:hypothetical protein
MGKHDKTLKAIFANPVSGNIRWADIESLLVSLGAEIEERKGSRIAVILNEEVNVYHRPHPAPMADKGAVKSVRRMLLRHDVTA